MTVPTFPTNLVSEMIRRLASAVASATSPFTGTQQVQDWGGRWWEYQLDLKVTQGRDARELAAFLAALGGSAGTFLLDDQTLDQASTPGTPLVNGASQTGTALVTDGWPVSQTVMLAGDFFSLGSDDTTRFYQLTADVVSNGSGAATLAFVPALRTSPADNDPLEVVAPKVLLRLTEPAAVQISPADLYRCSISAREAI